MRQITIRVPGKQQPAGSKRIVTNRSTGRAYVVDANPKSRDWKTTVAQCASDAWNGEPLMTGAIRLAIVLCVARPRAHYGAKGSLKLSAPTYPTTRPDLTKLVRAIEDALTGVIWRDDAQVVSQTVMKIYDEQFSTEVTIAEMSE